MKIGFIGTGAIAQHVMVGLIECGQWTERMVVSPRNAERAAALASRFENIEVAATNQDVVDQSDVVFLAVLPQQGAEVMQALMFDSHHTVVSLVAGMTVDQIRDIVGPDVAGVHRIIPMPPNEHGVGPVPIFPPSQKLSSLFNRIGTAIDVEDEGNFTTYTGSSSLMALFFEFTAANARWLEGNGVPSEEAATYASSLFHSLATMTCKLDGPALQGISQKCLTIGGLNEQVLNAALDQDWFKFVPAELGKILARITPRDGV